MVLGTYYTLSGCAPLLIMVNAEYVCASEEMQLEYSKLDYYRKFGKSEN